MWKYIMIAAIIAAAAIGAWAATGQFKSNEENMKTPLNPQTGTPTQETTMPGQITADDIFTSLDYEYTDITHGEAIFTLHNPTNKAISIDNANLKLGKFVAKGSNFTSIKAQEMKNVTVNTTIYESNCSMTNGTYMFTNTTTGRLENTYGEYEQCLQYATNGTATREEWADITTFEMAAGAYKKIRIIATWKAELGPQAREWIPGLTIGTTTYTQTKWAWWNSSWDKKIEINLTGTDIPSSYYVYNLIMNDSLLDYDKLQANGTDIRVVNSTEDGTIPFFMDYLNRTTNQNTSLYVNITNTTTKFYIYFNGTPTTTAMNMSSVFDLANDDCEDNSFTDWTVPSTKHTIKQNNTPRVTLTLGTANNYLCQFNTSASNNYNPTRKSFPAVSSGYMTWEYYAMANTTGGLLFASSSDTTNCYQGVQTVWLATSAESPPYRYVHYGSGEFNVSHAFMNGTGWYKIRTTVNFTGTHTASFGINLTGNMFSNDYRIKNQNTRVTTNHPTFVGFCTDSGSMSILFDNLKVYTSYEDTKYPTFTGEVISAEPPAVQYFNITIQNPTNTTYLNESQPVNISLNYTISLNGKTLDRIWYNLNGSTGSTTWCYQEQANESSACGGVVNTTTAYAWGALKGAIDGNWSTASSTGGYLNYTKPAGATNASVWQTGDLGGITNLTIPQSCWDYDANILRFRMPTEPASASWYCINSTTEVQLRNDGTDNQRYEEGMWWRIGTEGTSNITITGNTTFNAYYGWNNITVAMNATDGTYNQTTVFFTVNQTGGTTCWTCFGTLANIPSGTKCQISSLSNLCGS